MHKESKAELLRKIRNVRDRIDELHKTKWNAPRVPLEKKIFAGHWRFFKVREDVLRSSVGQDISKIVDACNHWILGKKQEPKSYRGSTEVFISKRGHHIPGQYLRPIGEDKMESLGFNEGKIRKWFDIEKTTIGAGTKTFEKKRYFPKVRPHQIEYDFKRAYITEVHVPDGDVESELAHLYKFMENHDGWKKLGEAGYMRDDWGLSLDKKRKLEKIRDKEMQAEALGMD